MMKTFGALLALFVLAPRTATAFISTKTAPSRETKSQLASIFTRPYNYGDGLGLGYGGMMPDANGQTGGGMMRYGRPYSSSIAPYRSSSYGNMYDTLQGGTRETYPSWYGEPTQVQAYSDGRPVEGEMKVWSGPNNTPQRVKFYSEDGYRRPYQGETQGGGAVTLRNTGSLEFPMGTNVRTGRGSSYYGGYGGGYVETRRMPGDVEVDGGALKTFSMDPWVSRVRVTLLSNGLPIMANIELWQGPGDSKQIAEVYGDNGSYQPYSEVIETPGDGSTIAIRNTGPVEYPLTARVEPVYDYY